MGSRQYERRRTYLQPYEQSSGSDWYKARQMPFTRIYRLLKRYNPDYVVVLSGDHIYKMDYSKMVERHKAVGAACTISVMEVPWSEASRFGIMSVDENDSSRSSQRSPRSPRAIWRPWHLRLHLEDPAAVSGG